ncbi:MAG: hypothetical protein GPOALKHO_001439 [Sodalis sp.]|nr:MAG: hypothetical protein GPOALKHO_001439 [Sodalis sp.]
MHLICHCQVTKAGLTCPADPPAFATLCDLRREPPAEIAETLYHNSLRLFVLLAKPAVKSHPPAGRRHKSERART